MKKNGRPQKTIFKSDLERQRYERNRVKNGLRYWQKKGDPEKIAEYQNKLDALPQAEDRPTLTLAPSAPPPMVTPEKPDNLAALFASGAPKVEEYTLASTPNGVTPEQAPSSSPSPLQLGPQSSELNAKRVVAGAMGAGYVNALEGLTVGFIGPGFQLDKAEKATLTDATSEYLLAVGAEDLGPGWTLALVALGIYAKRVPLLLAKVSRPKAVPVKPSPGAGKTPQEVSRETEPAYDNHTRQPEAAPPPPDTSPFMAALLAGQAA